MSHLPRGYATISLRGRYLRRHKPRISRWITDWPKAMRWHCTDGNDHGLGHTPADAYARWVRQCFTTRDQKALRD